VLRTRVRRQGRALQMDKCGWAGFPRHRWRLLKAAPLRTAYQWSKLTLPFGKPHWRPDVRRRWQTGLRRLRLTRRRQQMTPVSTRAHLVARLRRDEIAVDPNLPSTAKRTIDDRGAERDVAARRGQIALRLE
jgi:hypothetical protein